MRRPRIDQKQIEAWLSRINPADLERFAEAMMKEIDSIATNRWEAAVKRAAELPGDLRPDKVRALRRRMARELTAAGAAAGAAAASPLVGAAATMLTATAELALFTARAGDVVLTLAALHGRSEPTVDERRAWVLAVLIYGPAAHDGLSKTLAEAQTGRPLAAGGRLPMTTLQTANRLLSKHLLRRYGTRRGLVALGTALPLGLGAIVGGGANYRSITALVDHASTFFSRLPYSYIDVSGIELGGRLGPG